MASLVKVSTNLETSTLLTDFLTNFLMVILIIWWHFRTISPNFHSTEFLGGREGKGDCLNLLCKLT